MKPKSVVMAAAFVACAAVYSFGATQATFILTNGTRVSGELVFHGGQGNNMIDDQLNLRNNGKEQSYPADQVAVIDIAGGSPTQEELAQALRSDQSLVLRNGSVQSGHFVNIRNGSTLVWRTSGGQQQQYGLGDVTRVYLNLSADTARSLFNFNAPAASGSAATSGQTSAARAGRRGGAIQVPGNQPWVDTGIQVRAGDMVSFRVTGRVSISNGDTPVGPEGRTGSRSPNYPIPSMQVGSLIARVGNSEPFAIGSETAPIRMPADGVLSLGINDDVFGDNGGGFSVSVQVNGRVR